uniref:hypothetical protein n=1 Tax=uncultured Draconibacterium sp. TaxID=1573823 RepID=UPI0032163206
MDNYKMTSKDFFKSIQIIHFALMTGLIFFGAITFYLNYSGLAIENETEMNTAFMYVVPIFTISGIFASNFLFKQRLKNCVKQSTLKEKLNEYRSALIIKFAIIEGSSFFVVIAYYLTGQYIYLGFLGLLLIIFVTYRPTKEKAIMDLELSHLDKQLIHDSDATIN